MHVLYVYISLSAYVYINIKLINIVLYPVFFLPNKVIGQIILIFYCNLVNNIETASRFRYSLVLNEKMVNFGQFAHLKTSFNNSSFLTSFEY